MTVHHLNTTCGNDRRRRGLTLIELLLGMAVTALIGAALAAMLVSVAYGTSSEANLRRLAIKAELLSARIETSIRSSYRLLASTDSAMVIWMFDANEDGEVNLSELRRIAYDPDTDTLWSYRAPDDLSPASDTGYALDTNFESVTAALAGGGTFPGERWADSVSDWAHVTNGVAVTDTTLITFRFTVTEGSQAEPGGGSASFRSY